MAYAFYGWETADCAPEEPAAWPGIDGPRDLYDALLALWSAKTCAPRMRDEWSEDNPTRGQCSITAFLAQDVFGGRVFGIPLGDGNFHCYNVVERDGRTCVFDLTSEQFGPRAAGLTYDCAHEQSRETHFAKAEKHERYQRLRADLRAALSL